MHQPAFVYDQTSVVPREHVVAGFATPEVELERRAKGEPGTIREQVTHRCSFGPGRPSELRYVRSDRIVE